ncbi:ABC transporter substrate-binding protein [Natronospora cellulosivora (SeqCode)]
MEKTNYFVLLFIILLMTVFLMSNENVIAEEKPQELVMVFPIFGETPPDLNMVQEEVNKVTLEKLNVRVKLLTIDFGRYEQQINFMLSSGKEIDVLGILLPDILHSFISRGHLIQLNDLLNQYGQGIKDLVDYAYLQGTTIDGKLFSITALRDMTSGIGILMRKDIIDNYNLDISKIQVEKGVSLVDRLEPFDEIFAKIKAQRPNFTPLIPSVGGSFLHFYNDIVPLGDNFGVLLDKGRQLKVVNWFETEEYKELVYKMREWYEKGYILKDAATNTDSQFSLIRADKGFGYFSGTKPGIEKQESKSIGKEMIAKEIISPYTTTFNIQLISWGITRASKAPAKAMQFINLLYTDPDIANLLSYGVEGTHYIIKDNGLLAYPEGVNVDNVGYNLNTGWMFGNQMITHIWEGNPPTLWQDTIEFNENAYKAKSLGFVFDTSPVKLEIAALTTVSEKYRPALETGSVDPDSILPRFLRSLKDAGIDKVIAEKQRQLDEWASVNNIQ